jgi:hypothetical protein
MFTFFNHLESAGDVHAWAGGPERSQERSIVQWCVDHPLTIDGTWLDRMSSDAGFRLLTVSADDTHLLSLRFPNLRHATIWHGVAPEAFCDPAAIEPSHQKGRDIDVLVAGSIASHEELAKLKARVPGVLHGFCDSIVHIRAESPAMAFGQALDVCLPSGVRASDEWALMAAIFAYTTAAVGRIRRVAAVRALQGQNVLLVGTEAWTEFASGTIKYGGSIEYAMLPQLLGRSKVSLAVSPTQFATGFSERLLLSMAAGCATVAEERLAIANEFCTDEPQSLVQYPANRPELARIAVEKLLRDATERGRMGLAAHQIVAERHTWDHRVGPLLTAAGMLEQSVRQSVAA